MRTRLETEARLRAALLESEVSRFRRLPFLLANDADVLSASNAGPGDRRDLDGRFARLAERTGAGAIYLLSPEGVAISASNAASPFSFIGTDFGYRGYYRDARRTGSGLECARGAISGRPGLFLAQRTPSGAVVVVKLEFDAIEREWQRGGGVTLAANAAGTVLVTSEARLRFREDESSPVAGGRWDLLPGRWIAASVTTSIEDWRLVHGAPREAALGAAVPIARFAGALAALSTLALGWIVAARRSRRIEIEKTQRARSIGETRRRPS